MSSNSLVSILMPAYNAEKYLMAAIDSIKNQTHQNWELLILNDGSTDSTGTILKTLNDSRIKVFNEAKNQGYLASCNQLFNLAKGDFITFQDADDTCEPNRIEICLKEFEETEDLDFVTSNFTRSSSDLKCQSEHISNIDYTKYSCDPHYQPIVCCATIFVKEKLLALVGGYHTFFEDVGGEDYHWLFRLSRSGIGKHLDVVLYNYRQHEAQSHALNTNPLKYYFSDIQTELRASIIDKQIDLLESDSELKKRWLLRIESNSTDLLFRKASSMLNRNEAKTSIHLAIKALTSNPFSLTSWHRFMYLVYSNAMR